MSNRPLLRRQIREAWLQSMREDYATQCINSERSLQASLWSRLNKILPSRSRRMFVEPVLSVRGAGRQVRYPDLVICNSREVIGIIELKYQPRVQPKWQKDIATFQWIVEHRQMLVVANDRFRGIDVDARSYPLASDLLCVWAGVHAASDIRLEKMVGAKIQPFFLALHAETARGRQISMR